MMRTIHLQPGQKVISLPGPWLLHRRTIFRILVDANATSNRHTLPRANGPAFTAAVTKRRVAAEKERERETRDRIWAITASCEDSHSGGGGGRAAAAAAAAATEGMDDGGEAH